MATLNEIQHLTNEQIEQIAVDTKAIRKSIFGFFRKPTEADLFNPKVMLAIHENLVAKPKKLCDEAQVSIRNDLKQNEEALANVTIAMSIITGDVTSIELDYWLEKHKENSKDEANPYYGTKWSVGSSYSRDFAFDNLKRTRSPKLHGNMGQVYKSQLDDLRLMEKVILEQKETLKQQQRN